MSLESQCQDESFKGLDILISSSWPKGVSNFANQPVSILLSSSLLLRQSLLSQSLLLLLLLLLLLII